MPVPGFEVLMLPVLTALSDGTTHQPREISETVAHRLRISQEAREEMLPSGAMGRYRNRILWALHYLKRAGVVESPSRGNYVITDRGRALLAEAPDAIDTKTLERYPEYLEFAERSKSKSPAPETAAGAVMTPEERLDSAYEEIQMHVAADALERLRTIDPLRFERVVLEVLTAMGYGGSDPSRARLTKRSNDGGLDGVINEDALGLERVVVQAKRHNSPIDVKLIREFAGSLDEHGTDKGVFFTTDKFTKPALDYARSIKKRIVLIDGNELARLMVLHGVGVNTTKILRVVRVDGDYFEEPDA